ncbi:hypothetical protein V6C32_10835 [Desulforamulus ruminis]|uniref:hypothetical protein n=1 Tax=Desulforamulus ruminis TaxID=1564 RepID=UPI002FD9EA24
MQRKEWQIIGKDHTSGVYPSLFSRRGLRGGHPMGRILRSHLKNQRGIIQAQLLIQTIIPITSLAMIFALVFHFTAMYKDQYFDWVGGAADFATDAAVMGMEASNVVYLEGVAKEYFKQSLAGMVDGTVNGDTVFSNKPSIPGPIEINRFTAIEPGDSIPAGEAEQYGYLVSLEFPLVRTTLPLLGDVYLTAPMNYYAVATGVEK